MTDGNELPQDETPEEPGEIVASFTGSIVLRDPRSWDVSRANRPIVPGAPTVKDVEAAIDKAITELGFAVTVYLQASDK